MPHQAPGIADQKPAPGSVAWHRVRLCGSMAPAGQSMTNYARLYRSGFTPRGAVRNSGGGNHRRAAGPRAGRAVPPPGPCARPGLRPGPVHPRARAQGLGGRGHRLRAGRDQGGSSQEPGYRRAQLRRRRRDAAAAGPPGNIRLLPRHRLLPGPGRQTASIRGEGISALANPGATVLMLSFGPRRRRWLVEGASQEEVQTAFTGWEMLASEPADTAGLGWPMNKTAPRWYRLRRPA
jgi:hypothetical protein